MAVFPVVDNGNKTKRLFLLERSQERIIIGAESCCAILCAYKIYCLKSILVSGLNVDVVGY
jgi:hypothetical protein